VKTLSKSGPIIYESGVQIPLHIFGCLDPLTIILYFLCGADIFDGLAWLKYTFFNNLALYYNNHSLINAQWNNTYENIHMHNAIKNLNTLNTLTSHLNHYRRTKDFESLQLDDYVLQQVKSLTGAAGIDY
jgi:hypothetical protein